MIYEFENIGNFRDLGGMKCSGGMTIRSGLLMRSGHLGSASPQDVEDLGHLVDMVIELRHPSEEGELPDRLPEGTEHIYLSILDDLAAGISRDSRSDAEMYKFFMNDPEASLDYMKNMYMRFADSEYSRAQYGRFLKLVLAHGQKAKGLEIQGIRPKAVLWHCSAGKDRAGIASALVEYILGVPEDAIIEDYLLTNQLRAKHESLVKDDAKKLNVELSENTLKAMEYMLSAREEYLRAYITRVLEVYGSRDAFISEGLGFSGEEQEMLRALYLN